MTFPRRVFPESFKREVVDRVANSGPTAGAAARELGPHEPVLRRWMTQFGMQATGTSRCTTTQASSPSPSPSDLAAAAAGERSVSDRAGHPKKKPHSSWLRRPSGRSDLPMKFGFVEGHLQV
jgi:transposase